MTYCEVLLLIESREEHILAQEAHSLITNVHRYLRDQGEWVEDFVPGAPVEHYGKNGMTFLWKRAET
jgi:hypothetical protein